MTYTLFILGCQYNYHDAHSIAHLMNKMGYVYVADEKLADVIIVLACSVRQKPVDRIFGKLKIWNKLPRRPKIIVTACLLPRDRKKLAGRVEIVNLNKITHVLPKIAKNRQKKSACLPDFLPAEANSQTAHIPIMQGCNNFCTYCAVPYTRGREVSRPMGEIINELRKEIKSGKKHIILLGQNVNSFKIISKYLNTATKISGFIELLEIVDKIRGDFDYNFMSSNPHDFSDELVNALSKLKKWNRELHLPLQSGNDKILRKMNRKYTRAQYLSLIKNLILKIAPTYRGRGSDCSVGKNLFLSTDIIVGFPGETKKQFQDTISLCKKIGFDKAYISQYSPRPGTIASKMKDDVSRQEKKRRWKILNDLINKNE